MKTTTKLWLAFGLVVSLSFAVLIYYGFEIYQKAPPVPVKVVTTDNSELFSGQDIKDGQNVWQSMGGQEVGSIWGHGAYVAPDWTADWLHREALYILNFWAQQEHSSTYDKLDEETKAGLQIRLQKELRTNTYNPETKVLTISPLRAQAFEYLRGYYSSLFTDDPAFNTLRDNYAIPKNAIKDTNRLRQMNTFFFWASWACVTNRPGENVSYTHNWPPDKLIGNIATGDLIMWTGFSVILLLLGIGILAFYNARANEAEYEEEIPETDPLMNHSSTPSMRATLKYFWIVSALMLVQVILGVVTAHFGVEGGGFYGIPLDEILPYSLSRTWHVQLGIFWIATSWLATGLYIAPAVSEYEPKYQKLGVNVLFIALIVVVVGSMIGQWYGVMQRLGLVENFWLGHQGYEYVDLGRLWQIFLLVGLFLWLFLMVRALLPALRKKTGSSFKMKTSQS